MIFVILCVIIADWSKNASKGDLNIGESEAFRTKKNTSDILIRLNIN